MCKYVLRQMNGVPVWFPGACASALPPKLCRTGGGVLLSEDDPSQGCLQTEGPGGPHVVDSAHLLVVHPQHIVEIILLCVIFYQKIHLENPTAGLQLQAQHPHNMLQGSGGGETPTGTLLSVSSGLGCADRKKATGQAGPLPPTYHTHGDPPCGATGAPADVPMWWAEPLPGGYPRVRTHMTEMHPMIAVLPLSAQGPATVSAPWSYLTVAVVLDNRFQEGFGPLAQVAHPTRWKRPTAKFFCVTRARGNSTLSLPGLSLVRPDSWPLLPLSRSLNVPPPTAGGESGYIISSLLTSMAGTPRSGSGAVSLAPQSQGSWWTRSLEFHSLRQFGATLYALDPWAPLQPKTE